MWTSAVTDGWEGADIKLGRTSYKPVSLSPFSLRGHETITGTHESNSSQAPWWIPLSTYSSSQRNIVWHWESHFNKLSESKLKWFLCILIAAGGPVSDAVSVRALSMNKLIQDSPAPSNQNSPGGRIVEKNSSSNPWMSPQAYTLSQPTLNKLYFL